MIVIGLTGSIGMGKTTAANMLRTMGLPVHEADACVHALLGPGGKAVAEVAKAFPKAYDKKTNAMSRYQLGLIVFKDPQKRRLLESILHPHVRRAQSRFVRECRRKGFKMAVLDVPLLFEYGVAKKCDVTICVSAPYFLQKQRVLKRPHMTEERFKQRLANQIPSRKKERLADYVVKTGGGKACTFRQLRKIVRKIQEENH